MLDFTGKTALVTGATGGIGGAISKLLHKLGATVILSGTKQDVLDQLTLELGDRVYAKSCNLANHAEVEKLIDECEANFAPIDILVCNAGITKDGLSLRMSASDFSEVLDINLVSCFLLNKAALKVMLKRRQGRIINISSIIGSTGNFGQANYAASKAGLIGMSKSLAREAASRNITVNCVAPGFIVTSMTDKLKDEQKTEMLKSIPANRLGTVDDVASAVAFLASEHASYITGQTIHVNGGMLMV